MHSCVNPTDPWQPQRPVSNWTQFNDPPETFTHQMAEKVGNAGSGSGRSAGGDGLAGPDCLISLENPVYELESRREFVRRFAADAVNRSTCFFMKASFSPAFTKYVEQGMYITFSI